VLTFVVTCGQIVAEYYNTKHHIISELLTLEKTFSGSLTRAVWELNTQQAIDIAEGLVAIPMIKGISVTDEHNQIIVELGQVPANLNAVLRQKSSEGEHQLIESLDNGLFGHTFPLIFEFSGRTTRVGMVTLLSDQGVIFNRIEVGIYFLIGNAIVKTAFLVFLFVLAFNRLLTRPLNEMTEQINAFDIDSLENSKLKCITERNELYILQSAYNNLIDRLIEYREKLQQEQKKNIDINQQLDEQNLLLEQEVARKTSRLSNLMLELEQQKQALLEQKQKLEEENHRRAQTESTLIQTNQELKASIVELKKAQDLLLTTEKMAALGELSAEVSHEVNTPLSIGITSISYLDDLIEQMDEAVKDKTVTLKSWQDFNDNARNSVSLALQNLIRASELIASFKQVAVDQTSENIRQVNLAKYLAEIIRALNPKLKKTSHQIIVDCSDDIIVYTHAGAIAQIFTNLIINSLIHGFEHKEQGEIQIKVQQLKNDVLIHYQDNGCGVPEQNMPRLFEPFFTTKIGHGGSGLGTHIIYNLVVNVLNGEIKAHSVAGEGLSFDIRFSTLEPSIKHN
jgi:signal transduction histidine kinase